jgi:hypothetical protein
MPLVHLLKFEILGGKITAKTNLSLKWICYHLLSAVRVDIKLPRSPNFG